MAVGLAFVLTIIVLLCGLLSGVPIGYVFGVACLLFILASGSTGGFSFIVPASLEFMQSYAFLAVPLYVILGSLLLATPLSRRLLEFVYFSLPKRKGAFGAALVIFVSIFGAMTGSAAAAIASIGALVIPEAPRYGYEKEHAAGLLACSSLVAMLIPPSLTMIIFGVAGKLSIPHLFLATAVPGFLTAGMFIVVDRFLVRRWVTDVRYTPDDGIDRSLWKRGAQAGPVLVLPIVILGGIYGGVFTPTEAAAVAVGWVIIYHLSEQLFVSIRSHTAQNVWGGATDLGRGLIEGGRLTGAIALVIFFMFALSRILIRENVTGEIEEFVRTIVSNKYAFLVLANMIILMLGMILDDVSSCIISAVFLLPIAIKFGIDPYHFAAVVGVNVGLANMTPPVAPLLYLTAGIGRFPVSIYPWNKYLKTVVMLLLFGQVPVLILVTYVPEVSLFLPGVFTR